MADVHHPGEYSCIVSDGYSYKCVRLEKPLFSKVHRVQSLDNEVLYRNIASAGEDAGWSNLHVGHVLVAVNGQSVSHLSSSKLNLHLAQMQRPFTLTFCDELHHQIELKLQNDHGPSRRNSLVTLRDIDNDLALARAHILTNELDKAFGIVTRMPPGCHYHVTLFKAEIQCIRALVSGDHLSVKKAVDDSKAAVQVLNMFGELSQLAPKNKLLVNIALAEAWAFLAMAHIIAKQMNPALVALHKSHQMYLAANEALEKSTIVAAVPPSILKDIHGRVLCGLGVFALLTGVAPSEWHWLLRLYSSVSSTSSLRDGMTQLHKCWSQHNLRSPWAGVALMNATPMLLQHWAGKKPLPSPHSTSSTDDSDDDGSLLRASALTAISAECLERYPEWILVRWSHSVHLQQNHIGKALAMVENVWPNKEDVQYALKLHIGRLHFKRHDLAAAADTFQAVMTSQVKTRAMAANSVQQAACVHLAACVCAEPDPNMRFVRTLINQALRLDEGDDKIEAVHVHRARYYRNLPDFHMRLLPFDLLYLCTANCTRLSRTEDVSAIVQLDKLVEIAPTSSRQWLMAAQRYHSAYMTSPCQPLTDESSSLRLDDGHEVAFCIDWLTLRGMILLHIDLDAAKHSFRLVLSLASTCPHASSASFGFPISCFLLARELVRDHSSEAMSLLDNALQWYQANASCDANDVLGFLNRTKVLRGLLA
ncbi:hypothetical protein LEN26_018091 [Aphanomyces euteiches]|nr:hypothetical protein LEN26_018091 [Aphanomyces euteiches]